ncbi:hypothetical protein Leryth_006617 [Lithospermum erythrorhizon]|nr:hypothetical protein Leryth_006617 [Lithospermum erythrorhizon]
MKNPKSVARRGMTTTMAPLSVSLVAAQFGQNMRKRRYMASYKAVESQRDHFALHLCLSARSLGPRIEVWTVLTHLQGC